MHILSCMHELANCMHLVYSVFSIIYDMCLICKLAYVFDVHLCYYSEEAVFVSCIARLLLHAAFM